MTESTIIERVLRLPVKGITDAPCPWSPGSVRDFYSEADYWWPDPANPSGPFIKRDGESNPACFNRHRKLLIRMSCQCAALTSVWLKNGGAPLLERIQSILDTWFVDESTSMRPSLSCSQSIRGQCEGRSFGVIDTIQLCEVALSVQALRTALPRKLYEGVLQWFTQYLDWLVTSEFGQTERKAKNNHGVCWYLQAACFARLTGNEALLDELRQDFRCILLKQIERNGAMPRELARTKPYGYALFTLEVFAGLAVLLGTTSENCFLWREGDSGSVADAMAFLYPYILDKTVWPYPPDVLFFDYWPCRQSALLLVGHHTGERKYRALWDKLPPWRLKFELLRNFPVRIPELWLPQLSMNKSQVMS